MTYNDETIRALAALRTYAERYPTMDLSGAINTLDDAGVFAALDEQTDYAAAVGILAEAAVGSMEQRSGRWPDSSLPSDLRPTWAQHRRREADEHDHAFWDGRPDTMCVNEYCTLTYAEYTSQRS